MCRHNCAARGLDPGYSTPTWSMFTNPGAFAAVMIPAGSFALVAGMWMHSWGSRGRRFNPAAPTESSFSNIVASHKNQQKSHLVVQWPAPRRAPIECHGVPTGHAPTRQSRLRPTAKESKLTEPPQSARRPANGEPAGAIPGRTGSPQAGHSPHCSNCKDAGQARAPPAKPAHAALDATAAGVRTAFGRAATTVSIFTDPRKIRRHPHYGRKHHPVSSRLNAMNWQMSPRLFEPSGMANALP